MEERIKHYHSLMKKYLGWEFIGDNVDSETEYLNCLRNLIDEPEIDFENKMTILTFLVSGIHLKTSLRIVEG